MDNNTDDELELIHLFILILQKKKIPLRKLLKILICDEEKTNQPGTVRIEV